MNFNDDFKKLQQLDRDTYIKIYRMLGDSMFSKCYIPNIYDFSMALKDDEEAKQKIEQISSFTGNTDEIYESLHRNHARYTEEESQAFMQKVISANVAEITESGFFYKKVMAACDGMMITEDDCGSKGREMSTDIDEETYNFKVKMRWVTELGGYSEDYEEFKKLGTAHVRGFLTCSTDENNRHFCKKCAGKFRRNWDDDYTPKYIGLYAGLQVTEMATQASLDSMNKGVSKPMNAILEESLQGKSFSTFEDVKKQIEEIIDGIGYIGVQSRYYELVLLSRFVKMPRSYRAYSIKGALNNSDDAFGVLIYQSTDKNLRKLVENGGADLTSIKSKIALDLFGEENG